MGEVLLLLLADRLGVFLSKVFFFGIRGELSNSLTGHGSTSMRKLTYQLVTRHVLHSLHVLDCKLGSKRWS